MHLSAALRDRLSGALRAVHVNHGLHPAADGWAAHCQEVCQALDIPLTVVAVDCLADPGSIEAVAREARYRALADLLHPGEALLVAHHRDDQAETVLLRLLRGAGVHGMAAMPAERPLGAGRLLRPLLDFPAEALAAYAQAHRLNWIDDPSNQDARFDRNFLRHEVRPLLTRRWPGHAAPLARAAEQAREAAALNDALADLDLMSCARDNGIDVERLRALSEPRQRNLIRRWLERQGARPPGRERLRSGLHALTQAGADRMPSLAWDGMTLRRYRGMLILQRQTAPAGERQTWDLRTPLQLPGGQLLAQPALGAGLRADLGERRVEVRPRVGGERCRPAGRRHGQSLKKLLQEQGVPPWERARLPLIYIDDQLAAVGDLWVCEGYQAAAGEPGLRLVWQPRAL